MHSGLRGALCFLGEDPVAIKCGDCSGLRLKVPGFLNDICLGLGLRVYQAVCFRSLDLQEFLGLISFISVGTYMKPLPLVITNLPKRLGLRM